ncbi:MAG TPA: TetR/AcrR family transcriptional regulator [Variovorax sp.]|jgi:AcrR family transcriptional regulator
MAAPPVPAADLRQRILDTSEALLEHEGLSALSMREVARRAGVTHQAPYHHFADRETILAALMTRGFDLMTARLSRANDRAARLGQRAALAASGEAYVGLALEHPGVFRIMFRPELCDAARFPEALAASERAHEQLRRLVQLMHGGDYSESLASTYWAQVHGLAFLLIDGPMARQLTSLKERRAHMRQTIGHFADFAMAFVERQAGAID